MDTAVHGILQARILEWAAYPFSSGSSWLRNKTGVSCIAGGFFTNWDIREALKKKKKRHRIVLQLFLIKKGRETESQYFPLDQRCFWKSTAKLKNTEGKRKNEKYWGFCAHAAFSVPSIVQRASFVSAVRQEFWTMQLQEVRSVQHYESSTFEHWWSALLPPVAAVFLGLAAPLWADTPKTGTLTAFSRKGPAELLLQMQQERL